MRAEQIHAHLQRRPFEPIRVFLSDGSHYHVRHPDMAIVSARTLVIGIGGGNGMPEQFAFCDPVHVTRIEPLSSPSQRSPGGRRKK